MDRTTYRSFVTDNSIVIGGHILIYLKAIVIMPIIVKTVGVSIYGGFVLLTSMLSIVFGLSSFGTGMRARRFLPSTNTSDARASLFYPQFYFNLLGITCLSVLFMFLRTPLDTYLFKNEVLFSVWIIPLYLVSYTLYSQGTDYFRYTSRIRCMIMMTLCFSYLHIAFILASLYAPKMIDINWLVISMSVSALLVAASLFCVIFRELGARVILYSKGNFVSDVRLGFPLVINMVLDFILSGSDRYFIAFYLTVTDVGFYAPAYLLGSVIAFIPKAMGTALPQLMSKSVDSNNKHEAQQMLNYAIKIFFLAAIPFVFGSMVLGKSVLSLVANDQVAERARWVTPIVAVGTLFYGLTMILSNVLYVRLKAHAILNTGIYASVFSLLSNAVLFYFYKSIMVAAITTTASYLVAFLYVSRVVGRETWRIDYQPAVILKSVVASVLMGGLLLWLSCVTNRYASVPALVGLLGAGVVTYAGGLLALKTFTGKELQFIKSCIWR